MKKDFDKVLESGERFKFRDVNYSNPKVVRHLEKVAKEMEENIKNAEVTMYELEQISFPQFGPKYYQSGSI